MRHKDERETSCYCSACRMPPCLWCENDARECERCGKLFDKNDVLPSGYCEPCDLDRFVEHAILGAQSAPAVSPETLAIFGLDD